jgi:hypothetical protein
MGLRNTANTSVWIAGLRARVQISGISDRCGKHWNATFSMKDNNLWKIEKTHLENMRTAILHQLHGSNVKGKAVPLHAMEAHGVR